VGGIPDDDSYLAAHHNGKLLNSTINGLLPDDVLFIPNKTFTLIGGIVARDLFNVTFLIDGTLSFSDDRNTWPKDGDGYVLECIYMENIEDVIFTSSSVGILNGNGRKWWGAVQYLKNQEDRPRLLHINVSKNVLVEHLLLKDSPFWTFYAQQSNGLIVRYTDVDARWTDEDSHTLLDLQAFNTDGFDVSGVDVHIHDCSIWNQDDCISVKGNSANMLFERISCSGLGLVVGSIFNSRVHNITFRDSVMPNTVKGIYLKTRWSDSSPIGDSASISDVLYENITITKAQQFAIWIGPAQQTGECSLLWPIADNATCSMSGFQRWTNITLRNIYIYNPVGSPGVLYGNSSFPIEDLLFDNVVVVNPGAQPWGDDYYFCEGVHGYSTGGTHPVPPCFTEL
jgi:polygalacturonase